jgi:hypothetical protein
MAWRGGTNNNDTDLTFDDQAIYWREFILTGWDPSIVRVPDRATYRTPALGVLSTNEPPFGGSTIAPGV